MKVLAEPRTRERWTRGEGGTEHRGEVDKGRRGVLSIEERWTRGEGGY